jgi:short subunit dehydrogenase-like uncharacterized protein
VINCAGPFAATAGPVIDSAITAGIPYLDVTAELEVVTDIFADRVASVGARFDAKDFLGSLSPEHLTLG